MKHGLKKTLHSYNQDRPKSVFTKIIIPKDFLKDLYVVTAFTSTLLTINVKSETNKSEYFRYDIRGFLQVLENERPLNIRQNNNNDLRYLSVYITAPVY